MPYASTKQRDSIRRQLAVGHPPCALMITPGCQAVHGEIDYEAKSPHPRSFEADHIVPTEDGGDDSLENAQPTCRECNREKAVKRKAPVRSFLSPLVAVLQSLR